MKPAELIEKLRLLQTNLVRLSSSKYGFDWLDTAVGAVEQIIATTGLREGDWVRLRENYTFPQFVEGGQTHGWWPYRGTFRAGAVARVDHFDLYADRLRAMLKFPRLVHERTSPPPSRQTVLRDDDHVWWFAPSLLEKVSEGEAQTWIVEFDAGWLGPKTAETS